LVEFWAGLGNEFQTITMSIAISGKQKHPLTSMSRNIKTFRAWIPNVLHHENKKTDEVEHPEAFNHVGLLSNEPPGRAELLFI